MARNGSGNYTKVNTFTAGTPITAASHNQNWDDVAAEITNSVAADGQTTMTGPLKAASGTATAPSHSFGADPDTGGYRSGANEYSVSAGGAQITKTSSAGLDIKSGTLLVGGVAAAAIADGTALSVLGVTGNATAPRADLAASVDGQVLRRNGTALAFGEVATAGLADGAVTLAKQANLAAGTFIVRYTASTGVPQAGSFGSTLSLNTSSGALDVAVPASETFISSQAASTSAALTFTGLDSTYRKYVFEFDGIIPATNTVTFFAEVSDDGGSSWKSTGYASSAWISNNSGGSTVVNSNTDLRISNTSDVGNSSGYGLGGVFTLHAPSGSANRKIANWQVSYKNTVAAGVSQTNGGGYWDGTSAITAVRFRFSSGNITSGTITLYGIKGS